MNKLELIAVACLCLQCGLTIVWITTLSARLKTIERFLFGNKE